MIERRSTNRRINYGYLARLEERLAEFGLTLKDWPDWLIEQTWPAHQNYIKDDLGLDYCVRCHLPMHPDQVDNEFSNMCTTHANTARQALTERRNRSNTDHVSHLSKRVNLTHMDGRVAGIIQRAQHDERARFGLEDELESDLPPAENNEDRIMRILGVARGDKVDVVSSPNEPATNDPTKRTT